MKPERFRLLPHEVLFGFFLCVMWIRLVRAGGLGTVDGAVFSALIVVNAGLIAAAELRPGARTWMARLLFYPIAINVVFQQLRTAIPAVHSATADLALQAFDRVLVGGNLSMRLEPWVNPVATEMLSFCYLLFFPYLLFSIITYFVADIRLTKRFCVGLFSLYGIGFLGYSLVPASGPWIAMADDFSVPLTGGHLTLWNDAIVRMGSNGVDVFPSLHCAVSSFLLAFDFRHRRWRFWVYLVPAVGLWISTIYLRYHYFIDVVAGFLLAVFAIAVASRWQRTPADGTEAHVARY